MAKNLSETTIRVYRRILKQKELQASYNLKLKNIDYNRPGRPLKKKRVLNGNSFPIFPKQGFMGFSKTIKRLS